MTEQDKPPFITGSAIWREAQAKSDLLDQANERARRHQTANDALLKAFKDIEDQRAANKEK